MNKLKNISLLGLVGIFLVFTACESPRQTAYKTLASVGFSVDAAMKVYAEIIQVNGIDADTETEIDGLYETYRVSFKTAVILAKQDYNNLAPQDVIMLANNVITAIEKLASKVKEK